MEFSAPQKNVGFTWLRSKFRYIKSIVNFDHKFMGRVSEKKH